MDSARAVAAVVAVDRRQFVLRAHAASAPIARQHRRTAGLHLASLLPRHAMTLAFDHDAY